MWSTESTKPVLYPVRDAAIFGGVRSGSIMYFTQYAWKNTAQDVKAYLALRGMTIMVKKYNKQYVQEPINYDKP